MLRRLILLALVLASAPRARAQLDGIQERAAGQRAGQVLSRGGAIKPEDKAFLAEWAPKLFAAGELGRTPTSYERNTIEGWFPKLKTKGDWRVTGEACHSYNCIAWSVGVVGRWLWPGDDASLFDAFYLSYGFVPLASGESPDKADVAFWISADGSATHGCRRVAGDIWESKLGSSLRVLHRLNDLEGDTYGHVAKLYRRATPDELAARKIVPLPPDASGSDPCAASPLKGLRQGHYDLGSPRSDHR